MVLLVDVGAGRANACGDQLQRLLRSDQLRTVQAAWAETLRSPPRRPPAQSAPGRAEWLLSALTMNRKFRPLVVSCERQLCR